MSKRLSELYIFLIVCVLIALYIGCEADNPPSLFDPKVTSGPVPEGLKTLDNLFYVWLVFHLINSIF